MLAGFITVFAGVNIFTPVLFTVDRQCVYRALPLRSVMLACQILLLLLIAIYAVVSLGLFLVIFTMLLNNFLGDSRHGQGGRKENPDHRADGQRL